MKLLTIVKCACILFVVSCTKEIDNPIINTPIVAPSCISNKQIPQQQYNCIFITPSASARHSTCDMYPISTENYWIYRDSTFNKLGQLLSTRLDTVIYKKAFVSLSDSMNFWSKGQFDTTVSSLTFKSGVYSTDSAVYTIEPGMLVVGSYVFTKKEYYYPKSDSIIEPNYIVNDYQFGPRLIKKNTAINVKAGSFNNSLYINFITTGVKTLEFTEYYVPNLGIVKKETKRYQVAGPGGATTLSTYSKRELVDYKIN